MGRTGLIAARPCSPRVVGTSSASDTLMIPSLSSPAHTMDVPRSRKPEIQASDTHHSRNGKQVIQPRPGPRMDGASVRTRSRLASSRTVLRLGDFSKRNKPESSKPETNKKLMGNISISSGGKTPFHPPITTSCDNDAKYRCHFESLNRLSTRQLVSGTRLFPTSTSQNTRRPASLTDMVISRNLQCSEPSSEQPTSRHFPKIMNIIHSHCICLSVCLSRGLA